MKQILKIEVEVPEGKTAVWRDGKVVYEDILPKLPETWEEFCKLYPLKAEVFIDSTSQLIYRSYGKSRHYSMDKNLLPSQEAGDAHLALMQLHQLRDCYRQGWTPDWKNSHFDKYCIEFSSDTYIICTCACHRNFLSFQSIEIARKFLKNFRKLIEQAGDLI